MATNQENSPTLHVNFIPDDLTKYILTNIEKINRMFYEGSCSAMFIKGQGNKLGLRFKSNKHYSKAFDILNGHLKYQPQFSLVSAPPLLESAEIELDEATHHYTTSHLAEINHLLTRQFGDQVRIEEGSEVNNIKISAPSNDVIRTAFSFLKEHLEHIHMQNVDNQTEMSSHEQPPPTFSDDKDDIKSKKYFIPEALYDLSQLEIENIFKQSGVEYSQHMTTSNTVILDYEGSCQVVDSISEQLNAIRKKYQELKHRSTFQPSCTYPPTSPSDQDNDHYSFQHDGLSPALTDVASHSNQSSEDVQVSNTQMKPPQPEDLDFWQDDTPHTNDLVPVIQPCGSGNSPDDTTATNIYDNLNPKDVPEQTPAQFPDTQHQGQPPVLPKPRKKQRENALSQAMKGSSTAPTQTLINLELDQDGSQGASKFEGMSEVTKKQSIDPNSINTQNTHAMDPLAINATNQPRTQEGEDVGNESLKKPQMSSTPPTVRTSSFNHPQVVGAISSISHESPQAGASEKDLPRDTPPTHSEEVSFSHQSLDAIIQFHDNFACVVKLPEGIRHKDAKYVEHRLLNLRVIPCPNQEQVVTLVADEKEIVKSALKQLSKKFSRLGYLPPCNGIHIMTDAVKSTFKVDETERQLKKGRVLASLTCSSGINITLKHMKLEDGNWDAVLKSADTNSIKLKKLENLNIIDVFGDNITKKDSRNLATTLEKMENWQFFVTDNKISSSKNVIHLVLPGWNPVNFKGSHFKKSIKSVLDYCNRRDIRSVAFPVIGHDSKRIPIPLSAQALLQGIDDFSVNISKPPKLQNIDIIIGRDTQIRSFLYHFVTPIQNQIRQSKYKKIVGSDPVDEEEEKCPICLDPLDSDVTTIRQLTKCKHEFHESCIVRAIEMKPICPLCTTPLGVQRGNQPPGGKMSHTTGFNSLSGYPGDGTITIHYQIPGGVQDESHPNPGVPYSGTTRTAYLPDNEKGRRVLSLLQVGFDRALIFTVGTSRTSGMDNMVTWNDIHHKTSVSGTHGYPDMEYLDRVLAELKDKGVQ